jgi:hypothetical protein
MADSVKQSKLLLAAMSHGYGYGHHHTTSWLQMRAFTAVHVAYRRLGRRVLLPGCVTGGPP